MSEDPRCCGSGTCIIDAEGRCWCGQRWDGEKMCHAPRASSLPAALAPEPDFPPPGMDQDPTDLPPPAV